VVAVVKLPTWTNGMATNRLRSLHNRPMQLYALEMRLRISTYLKLFVDFMRNQGSGPEPPSGRRLQARASKTKISENPIEGCIGCQRLLKESMSLSGPNVDRLQKCSRQSSPLLQALSGDSTPRLHAV